jgi:hypothetical protein
VDREKFTLDFNQGCDVIDGIHDDFKKIEEEIYDTRRWTTEHSIVVQRLSDNRFFECCYRSPSTEQQGGLCDYNDKFEFKEVFPVEKKVIVYQ